MELRLISLNAWGGRLHQPLIEFVRQQAAATGIFCFQEIFSSSELQGMSNGGKLDLFQDLCAELKDFAAYPGWKAKGYDYLGYIGADIDFGNVMFVNNALPVDLYQELFEVVTHPDHDWKKSTPGKAQFIEIGNLIIC